MKVTRKGFISSVATAAAALSIPARPVLAGLAGPSLDGLGADAFDRHIGATFIATREGRREELTLIKVQKVRSCARTQQFSLVFKNVSPAPLESGMYRLTHKALHGTPLLLTQGVEDSVLRADFSLLRA